ncbi:MAG: 5-methylthioadenosine/S-adenosylhomocysteine deaminase [Acidobacteriota bacterium]|jgi:5-methylthioadenosine/S-adenosylhomocysteine deaminase|nr:5-methylthioadenosine/S-adenosylhomocysteine deaminase [Acidobacteriota bacterium]
MIRRALLLFAFACSAVAVQARTVDILITGGTVVSMAGPNLERASVAIDKGVIVAVGPSAEIDRQYSGKTVIRAGGMAVLPGFVNAHTHVPMTLFRGIADDRELMDWLNNFIFPAEAKNVDRGFVKWGTRLAAVEMIRSGTTTFADMYYFESDIARETKAAGLRGVLGETVLDFPAPDNKTWEAAMAYMREYVAKWKGDALITPAFAPHAPFTVSKEHLQQVRAMATELGAPILIHVSETKAELAQVAEKQNGMTPGAYLDSIGFLGDDVVAAHGVWLTPEELRTFAAKKTGVVHCPESNMMLASGIAPVVDMLRANMEVGLGTDGPAGSNNNLDMLEEMASAARLQKVGKLDPKAISARDVLMMATIGGARVLGLADKIGTLEAGKRADVVIIDLQQAKSQPVYSVESAIVYAASGSSVVTTIVDGKILLRHGKVLTVNEAETVAKAKEYRDKVVASLQK